MTTTTRNIATSNDHNSKNRNILQAANSVNHYKECTTTTCANFQSNVSLMTKQLID